MVFLVTFEGHPSSELGIFHLEWGTISKCVACWDMWQRMPPPCHGGGWDRDLWLSGKQWSWWKLIGKGFSVRNKRKPSSKSKIGEDFSA